MRNLLARIERLEAVTNDAERIIYIAFLGVGPSERQAVNRARVGGITFQRGADEAKDAFLDRVQSNLPPLRPGAMCHAVFLEA
jgi:hypothetical protein